MQEDRNSQDNFGCGEDLDCIRTKLYELFPGDWHTNIVDLGNVSKGNAVSDTYFAVSEIITSLLKKILSLSLLVEVKTLPTSIIGHTML